MGYTHYFNTRKTKESAAKLEQRYQLAIKKCGALVRAYNADLKKIDLRHEGRLSGYSAHTKDYKGLHVNGTKDLAHEDFIMREHFNQNFNGEFCKTAQKPYDVVVVACLIILKHYLGDAFQVSSDGCRADWQDGFDLAVKYTGLKTLRLPDSIEARQPRLKLVD